MMLSKIFGKKEKIVGFIYVPDSNQGHFKNANIGQTIKTEKKGPPWIVVDHSLENVVIAKWPGTLWRAEVKDEAKNTGLLEYAKYTRANAVKIIERLPLEILFGDFGSGILKIVESAGSIDSETAKKLANVFFLNHSNYILKVGIFLEELKTTNLLFMDVTIKTLLQCLVMKAVHQSIVLSKLYIHKYLTGLTS